jgi:hypothetical protein
VPYASRFIQLTEIAYGHAILVVGACALYLGMKQFQSKDAMPRTGRAGAVSGWEVLFCFVAGTVIVLFSSDLARSLGGPLAALSPMPLAGLSLLAIKPPLSLRRIDWAYWSILMAGTLILLLVYARGDSKMMLSFSFVPLGLATLRRGRALVTIAMAIGFIALYLVVVAPLVTNIRTATQRTEQTSVRVLDTDALDTVSARLQSQFRDDPAEYLNTWLKITMLRLADPVPAGLVAGYAASGGLLRGAGMDYILTSFVPRMFWHDKPVMDRGRYFTVVLGMASDEHTATTSSGQTAAGELFWNFGWFGVIIGMYLLGAVLSGVWWGADKGDPTSGVLEMTAFIGVVLYFVLAVGSAAGTVFVGAVTSGVILRALILVRTWITPRSPGRTRDAVVTAPEIVTCR